ADAPRVHVSAIRTDDMWRIAVRANGIGIAAADRERIFAIFQRGHRDATHPGTGIGLAICKKIVERHGGRLTVESAPDAGSTFTFTLSPVATGRAAVATGRAAVESATAA